jgi:hypothetical protein
MKIERIASAFRSGGAVENSPGRDHHGRVAQRAGVRGVERETLGA